MCKNRNDIQVYLNAFRNALIPNLKEDVAIKAIVCATPNGVVITFELGTDISNSDVFRSDAPSISEALYRTNVFSNELKEQDIRIEGTTHIISQNKIILVKDSSDVEWSAEKAKEDVLNLISSLNRD